MSLIYIRGHCLIYIRGHCLWLHLLLSTAEPGQVFPPLAGFGLLHFRVFVIVPNPHVTLHVENRVQGPQLPSTKKVRVIMFDKMMCYTFLTYKLRVCVNIGNAASPI